MNPVWHFLNGVPQIPAISIGTATVTTLNLTTLNLGADTSLSSGSSNRIDIASGDSLYLVSGGLGVGVTPPSAGSIHASANVEVGAANAYSWLGRSQVRSPANGQANFTNAAESAGVGFDFAADAELKLRTRAQSAYATLDVLGLKASGAAGASFNGAVTNITVVNGIVTAVS